MPSRVNTTLALDFGDVQLTSYAGLEWFQQYLRRIDFNRVVRDAFVGAPLGGDLGAVAIVRLLVGLLVIGGRRLRHLAYAADDPLFRRFCQVHWCQTARTVSRWLTAFTMTTAERLQRVNAAVIAQVVPGLRLRTITIDVDGVVVSTGPQVERACRGFNPHRRRRRTRKHTTLPLLQNVQTLRFVLLNRAATLVRPHGRFTLRLTDNAPTRQL